MSILTKLAAAAGPDRELDCLIREHLDPRYTPKNRVIYYGEPTGEHVGDDGQFYSAPAYTASLDAAMTLVPEGFYIDQIGEWDNEKLRAMGPWLCIVKRRNSADWPTPTRAQHAPTPALALCIAALSARGIKGD